MLAALSQTVVSGFYKPWRKRRSNSADDERHYLAVSKVLVVLWAVILCAMAQLMELAYNHYGDILNLALAMASYTGGAMLAAFCLAFFRLNVDYRGILWATPISLLTVFAISWHTYWAQITTALAVAFILARWIECIRHCDYHIQGDLWRTTVQTAVMLPAVALPVFLCSFSYYADDDYRYITVAWPWNVPLGFVVAFSLGYILAGRTARMRQ